MALKNMGKKGIFFTLMAITLVTIIVLSFSGAPKISFTKDKEVTESEFLIINSYVKDVTENYIPNILLIQGKGALNYMLDGIYDNSNYYPDVNATFLELAINGTLGGAYVAEMNKMGISNWTEAMDEKSSELLGIRSKINVTDVYMEQIEPWFITIAGRVLFNASRNNMSYHINRTIKANISIIGLRDPVYMLNKTNHTIEPIDTAIFNNTVVVKMLRDGSYRYNRFAPSYIMRLGGDFNSSGCCGIESLINSTYLKGASSTLYNVTFVDYLFWSQHNRTCDIGLHPLFDFDASSGIENSFKLDSFYMALYNLTDEKDTQICEPPGS